ncbi:protein ORF44 [Cyprinid herpesvirus 3]|uniref:ORF44R n=1 Tax=Cyprinid herpesvirus 3 TaxID=180230 RepID=A3QML2_CYHV3|nr:unnamed protein product [Cyprinid herpesvirus 3]ABC55118.1 hypothetical protein [Cyprinid herpesvirus 3]ABG42871.1 protein ORF44 [Cyprinid herpesvirus 3]AIC32399.1 ORF44R [Cyprinid herpesvirus 3]AJP55533.1 protein ORF44 [Cyprinid herpesvirus 3]AJP55690.1 protein ORF44 [Cyprinid herpesvirus 3]
MTSLVLWKTLESSLKMVVEMLEDAQGNASVAQEDCQELHEQVQVLLQSTPSVPTPLRMLQRSTSLISPRSRTSPKRRMSSPSLGLDRHLRLYPLQLRTQDSPEEPSSSNNSKARAQWPRASEAMPQLDLERLKPLPSPSPLAALERARGRSLRSATASPSIGPLSQYDLSPSGPSGTNKYKTHHRPHHLRTTTTDPEEQELEERRQRLVAFSESQASFRLGLVKKLLLCTEALETMAVTGMRETLGILQTQTQTFRSLHTTASTLRRHLSSKEV